MKVKPTIEQIELACETILSRCNNHAARAYARAVVDRTVAATADSLGTTYEHALVIQANYILCNITHWRGEEARQIRQLLKDFTKE